MPDFLDFAMKTAKAAGKLLMEYQGELLGIEYKNKTDVKSEADMASDRLVRRRIARYFPSHEIMSEESKKKEPQLACSYTWVVDPLDGTIPFLEGENFFGVSIALAHEKHPILGVIFKPKLDEMWYAEKGKGAFLNGKSIGVSKVQNINECVVGTDFGTDERRLKGIDIVKKLMIRDGVTYVTTYACATHLLTKVADGARAAYVSSNLDPWDIAAGAVICREAGALVTTLEGNEWGIDSRSIVAAAPGIYNQLMKLLV